jgi:hypothetical protein
VTSSALSASRDPLDPEPQVTESAPVWVGDSRDGSETPARRGFTLVALNAILAWRPLAVFAYAGSAASFLIGVVFLYDAEGPGRPDVENQLST